MEGEKNRKRRLQIDWNNIFNDDDPPPELEVTSTAVISAPSEQKNPNMGGGEQQPPRDELYSTSDTKLDELITRQKRNVVTLGPKLPDKGEKLKAVLKRYEDEKERRKNRRVEMDDDCKSNTQTGASNGFRQGAETSSCFASLFAKKLDGDTDGRTVNAFEKELSSLNACGRKKKLNKLSSSKPLQKSGLSSRQTPFKCPISISVDVDKNTLLNGDEKGGRSSSSSPRHFENDFSDSLSKSNASQIQSSRKLRPRKGQTVVLVDEEEPKLQETTQKAEKADDCLKDITIYYPSRDDPESIEIIYSDMECLAPETYLSSTIMNFYIRYLQQPMSPNEKTRCDYHFFNTYFYKKLKEAIQNKRGDRETSFAKFRRWWKGVNIFEKAYILLPIHENLHWSLVIICIPDKEEESGPIILHLDSLGLHYSRSIFENIKSFLKEEWNYLKGEAPTELPLASRIWQNLPRRIGDEIIKVPQQKNEYDCGLFVLFFMERFIEEAPERLKMKDLTMFGRQWFRPEEASGLRQKIRSLLVKEFKKKQETIEDIPKTSPSQSTK